MAEELRWGAQAVDPRERSLPGLKASFLVQRAPVRGRVLEIGSGDGKMLRTLHAAQPELELFGCDVRQPRTTPDCYTFRRIVDSLPEEWTNTFDAVLLMDVLEHVPDPTALLAEAARVLRPDGELIAFIPIEGEPLSAYTIFRTLLGKDVYVETKDHVQAFRHEEAAALLGKFFEIRERMYAYHALGQTMDAAFFAAQKLGKIRDMWRRDNSFYNAEKKDVGGAVGVMNRVLRAANVVAWAESRALTRVRTTSAGLLVVAGRAGTKSGERKASVE